MKKIVEICCANVEDVILAELAGADRVELNSALYLGGLTPSLGTLIYLKQLVKIPIICMLRPRAAGFCYDAHAIETMKLDAQLLLENGADGLAFGALHFDRSINVELTQTMVTLTHKYNKEFVFHRAFDCVDDPISSIETLIECKVDRVLTSGLKSTAIEGKDCLRFLQAHYGDKIEFLIAGKVSAHNANELIDETNIPQIHAACKSWKIDLSTHNDTVSYAYGDHPSHYEYMDVKLVDALVKAIKQ